MVAPLGPASAEALRLTFVNPPAGALTMTCVSTVSPRAPEKLMEEAVPGASVCPTLSRPDCTQTGNGAVVGGSPTPAKVTAADELVALLATVTLPVKFCATVGANTTVSAA